MCGSRQRPETRILKMKTRYKNTQDEDLRQKYSRWTPETRILKTKTRDKNTQDEDSRQEYSRWRLEAAVLKTNIWNKKYSHSPDWPTGRRDWPSNTRHKNTWDKKGSHSPDQATPRSDWPTRRSDATDLRKNLVFKFNIKWSTIAKTYFVQKIIIKHAQPASFDPTRKIKTSKIPSKLKLSHI